MNSYTYTCGSHGRFRLIGELIADRPEALPIAFAERPEANRLIGALRQGDSVYVPMAWHISRSLTDLDRSLTALEGAGATVVIGDLPSIGTPLGRTVLEELGAAHHAMRGRATMAGRQRVRTARRSGAVPEFLWYYQTAKREWYHDGREAEILRGLYAWVFVHGRTLKQFALHCSMHKVETHQLKIPTETWAREHLSIYCRAIQLTRLDPRCIVRAKARDQGVAVAWLELARQERPGNGLEAYIQPKHRELWGSLLGGET